MTRISRASLRRRGKECADAWPIALTLTNGHGADRATTDESAGMVLYVRSWSRPFGSCVAPARIGTIRIWPWPQPAASSGSFCGTAHRHCQRAARREDDTGTASRAELDRSPGAHALFCGSAAWCLKAGRIALAETCPIGQTSLAGTTMSRPGRPAAQRFPGGRAFFRRCPETPRIGRRGACRGMR